MTHMTLKSTHDRCSGTCTLTLKSSQHMITLIGSDLTGQTRSDYIGMLVVYIDGAAPGNGTANCRAGIGIYFGPNHPANVSERMLQLPATNQRAEVYAAIRALQIIPQDYAVEFRTDSNYLVQAVTDWSRKWRVNGFQGTKGPVQNADLFRTLLHMLDSRSGPVLWTHVRGHSGDPGNEAADRLAVAGANA